MPTLVDIDDLITRSKENTDRLSRACDELRENPPRREDYADKGAFMAAMLSWGRSVGGATRQMFESMDVTRMFESLKRE